MSSPTIYHCFSCYPFCVSACLSPFLQFPPILQTSHIKLHQCPPSHNEYDKLYPPYSTEAIHSSSNLFKILQMKTKFQVFWNNTRRFKICISTMYKSKKFYRAFLRYLPLPLKSDVRAPTLCSCKHPGHSQVKQAPLLLPTYIQPHINAKIFQGKS
jgi:hypothetical protein